MTNHLDRAARAGLGLLGLINVLFLIAFLAALLFASGHAAAEAHATCTGKDMIAELTAEDPETLARIRAQAAAVPNGSGLLWRIEHPGARPSFLFGTMHMSDPRVVKLPAAAQIAFDGADTIVIETTDILDNAKMGEALLARPELMMFTDATTLPDLLSGEDRALVEKELGRRGIPLSSVRKMKPWMLSALVSLPACELARKTAGAPVLDVKLANDAKTAGKELEGLESMTEQLEAMASLPMEFHIEGLVETLRLGDRVEDVMETMVRLYIDGQTGMFWPFFEAALPSEGGDQEGFAAFQEALIDVRNRTMAEGAAPLIEKGGAFIAVGALHLPGKDGLVELLRQQGFRVEAVE
jgi:uncharacterized protein